MYIISNYDLTQAIIKAKMRGVHVRVITDHKMFDNNQNLEKMMRKGELNGDKYSKTTTDLNRFDSYQARV